MNKLEKMSYKGYSFATNPSVIKIRHRARVTKNSVPFQAENTVSLAEKRVKSVERVSLSAMIAKSSLRRFASFF